MKRALIALALAAALPLSAQAGELNYNYVQAGYANSHFVGEDFPGWSLDGSVKFNDMFYGTASYRNVDKSGVQLDESTVNFGFRHAISDKADFIAELGYINYGLDIGSSSANVDGYRVAGGVRGFLSDKFEGTIKVNYTDVNGDGSSSSEFGGVVSGTYHINDTWGITASYDTTKLGETVNTWGLGVRASF